MAYRSYTNQTPPGEAGRIARKEHWQSEQKHGMGQAGEIKSAGREVKTLQQMIAEHSPDQKSVRDLVLVNSHQAPAKLDRKSPTWKPERRLWELASSTNSKKLATIELFVFVLFLILASVAMVAGFAELSHLLQTDAVGHVATRVMSRGLF